MRMFTRMDSIGQIRICSNHIIISSYHASYVILSIRLNCFEQLSQFVALATRGHGGELLQEQTIIVECLDGLEEHCHHLCLKLKKNLLVIGHQFLKVFDILYFGLILWILLYLHREKLFLIVLIVNSALV